MRRMLRSWLCAAAMLFAHVAGTAPALPGAPVTTEFVCSSPQTMTDFLNNLKKGHPESALNWEHLPPVRTYSVNPLTFTLTTGADASPSGNLRVLVNGRAYEISLKAMTVERGLVELMKEKRLSEMQRRPLTPFESRLFEVNRFYHAFLFDLPSHHPSAAEAAANLLGEMGFTEEQREKALQSTSGKKLLKSLAQRMAREIVSVPSIDRLLPENHPYRTFLKNALIAFAGQRTALLLSGAFDQIVICAKAEVGAPVLADKNVAAELFAFLNEPTVAGLLSCEQFL